MENPVFPVLVRCNQMQLRKTHFHLKESMLIQVTSVFGNIVRSMRFLERYLKRRRYLKYSKSGQGIIQARPCPKIALESLHCVLNKINETFNLSIEIWQAKSSKGILGSSTTFNNSLNSTTNKKAYSGKVMKLSQQAEDKGILKWL